MIGRSSYAEFEAFIRLHEQWLSKRAHGLAAHPQDAQDLLQTVLLKVASQWRRVSGADNPAAYVERIMTNAAIDTARRSSRRASPVALEALSPGEGPYATDEQHQVSERDAVRQLLAELPPAQRAVVVLRHLEDQTEAQVAHQLGISVGTVKSHNARALQRLRDILTTSQEESHDPGQR